MGESALKVIKIKNLLEKGPVKHPSSYKNIFNVQKENGLMSRESVTWVEICLTLKYIE